MALAVTGTVGSLVFLFLQCQICVKTFKKWKRSNTVIHINSRQLPVSDDFENIELTETAADLEHSDDDNASQ